MENRKIIISDNGKITVPSETKMSVVEIANLLDLSFG